MCYVVIWRYHECFYDYIRVEKCHKSIDSLSTVSRSFTAGFRSERFVFNTTEFVISTETLRCDNKSDDINKLLT